MYHGARDFDTFLVFLFVDWSITKSEGEVWRNSSPSEFCLSDKMFVLDNSALLCSPDVIC